MTYAIIAYLFTFQPFSTVLCSPNACLKVKSVSPELLFLIIAAYYDILDKIMGRAKKKKETVILSLFIDIVYFYDLVFHMTNDRIAKFRTT